MLPYANNSDLLATRQNKNNQLHGFGKLFHDLICQVLLKVSQKYATFYRILLFTSISIESSQF